MANFRFRLLDDPLWRKLDSAYGELDIPERLRSLKAGELSEDDVSDWFYGSLVHQSTTYTATYAVAPHLVAIANAATTKELRTEIAHFLGHATFCALHGTKDANRLPGLKLTLPEFEKQRALWQDLARSDGFYQERAVEALAIPLPTEEELQKLALVRDEFFELLPSIEKLCAQAFVEAADIITARYHLLGVAAARRMLKVAACLELWEEGEFECPNCSRGYVFEVANNRVVATSTDDGAQILLTPWSSKMAGPQTELFPDSKNAAEPGAAAQLIELIRRSPFKELEAVVRDFLGSIKCTNCEAVFAIDV